jgi:hypothetical protein
MLIDQLKRTVASTGGTLHEVPTRSTKLSQFCHGCGAFAPKPLWQRWHRCPCGIGPVQRDLYSAFLAAFLDPADPIPSCARYVVPWEGAEARLRAAHEREQERAKEGQVVPRSMGITRAGARLPESRGEATQELLFLSNRGKVEAWKRRPEPPATTPGESSGVAHHGDRDIRVGDGRRPACVVDHVQDATEPGLGEEDRKQIVQA